MAQEKRENVRIKLDRRVAIKQSNGSIVYAQAKDISPSGIAVISEYYCDIGQEFDILFKLSSDPKIPSFEAHVVTRFMNFVGGNKYQIGLFFLKFKNDSNKQLLEYLKYRKLQPKYSSDLGFKE